MLLNPSLQTTQIARRGVTLLELLIAVSILTGILIVSLATFGREGEALQAITDQSQVSQRGQQLLGRLDDLLRDAEPFLPDAWLTEDSGSSQTTGLSLDRTLGFPDQGTVILEPGTLREERINYSSLSSLGGIPRLLGLERGQACTDPAVHGVGARALWSGAGFAIPQQISPNLAAFDGISLERGQQVFYRGDGTGFSFRVPTDPTGGNDVLDGLEVLWGATLRGQPLSTARSAIVFEVTGQVTEAELDLDIDGDNMRDATFDMGELHLRTWDTADSGVPSQTVSLGGTRILQRQCDHGGDLDSDGFDDPMFLWTPETGRLRIRLFFLSHRVGKQGTVSRQETVLHLRNPPAS